MSDPELEALKRSVHLAEYARSVGYEPRARDSTPGVTVLEHPHTHDRVAVARTQRGPWIFASLPDYEAPPGDESADRTRERLRDCIVRSRDQGSVLEFVQHCQRVRGHREPTLEEVRAHLRAWQEVERGVAPDVSEPPKGGSPRGGTEPGAPAARDPVGRAAGGALPLNRRIGDWAPSPALLHPDETEVQARLRRWQEAQRAIDLKLARAAELANPRPALANSAASRGGDAVGARPLDPAKRELGQRRYDWTPPVSIGLGRTLRDRGSDRGR
jgi:hypothetical protein